MNILISGGHGFLGKAINKELSKINNIFILGRTSGDFIGDIRKGPVWLNENFDVVIHAAGKAHLTPSNNEEEKDFFDVNLNGTFNLLNSFSYEKLPKSIVFISTVSVYGLRSGNMINEEAPLKAVDAYGKSKIEAEQLMRKWCDESNVVCTILRLPLVVGSNPPGNLGAMIRAIKKGYYFNVAGGKAKKSMVLASDVAKFILKASKVGGTFNLTDGFHPTFNELSESISKKVGKSFVPNLPGWTALILSKFGDLIGKSFPINSDKLFKITSSLTFDDSRARKAFGWEPTPVVEWLKSEQHV